MNLQRDELFAEKLAKVKFRDFTANTRLDIKNVALKSNQVKRDRALNYWNLGISSSVKDTSSILQDSKKSETPTMLYTTDNNKKVDSLMK
jgi:hypothetical protein